MTERTPVIAGNWKMELSHKAATEVTGSLKKLLQDVPVSCDVVVCPSFPSLPAVAEELVNNKKIQIGAQNVHWEEKGAWTGEVSVAQIHPFVKWCIVGHSERRRLVGETDEQVQQKAALLQRHGITPIVCIGETQEEREQERTVEKITQQVGSLISGLTRVAIAKLVVAYEPIWAIGTGITPDPNEAAETMLLVRKLIAERFDQEIAERLRILYGGSVNAENVQPFVSEPGVDGVLVGSASLRPLEFVNIIKAVQSEHAK